MKVSFSEEATQDVIRLRDFLEPMAPGAAKNAVSAIISCCMSLSIFPARGSLRDDGSRQLVIALGASPYIARYRIDSDKGEVVILHVRHGREAQS